jgi:hypothetical protein
MRTVSDLPRSAPCVLQATSIPAETEVGVTGCAVVTPGSAHMAEHDATLLVAALEEVEARRRAIEWLLDANLLCLVLV